MEQYIKKSALVAEIEKLIERAKAERVLYPKTILAAKNYLLIEDYKKLLSFIDSLEVKEVDLEDAASRYAKEEYNHKRPATLPNRCRGCYAPLMYAFKAGAQYKEQQMMKDAVDACVTDIRTYKEDNEVDFTVMYEKGIIPYEIEQEVKLIIIKED